MRISRLTLIPALFAAAALGALLAAWLAAGTIEKSSKSGVERQLRLQGHEWAHVAVDGLQIYLTGTAPNEATRFKALSIAGTVVDATRVIDNMQVKEAEAITPPSFSIEILRNDSGISLIGLIPAATDREVLAERIREIAGEEHVTDLMEAADYPAPADWDKALEFSIGALAMLPRSKISVTADRVAITAISERREEKRNWETSLARSKPEGLVLALDISAPRPVITPFTLRFLIDDGGARFDACSAHTPKGRTVILTAAGEAGLQGKADCTIGLGVPSPDWPQAVARAIAAVKELNGGSVTFSDADVTLVAPDTTPPDVYDKVVGELEAELPGLYSLHAVLPEAVKIDGTGVETPEGQPEFIATLSPEGQVQLRGRLTDERQRSAVISFAMARFGVFEVYAPARLDPELPEGWSARVLAALEALSFLSNGVVVVQPDVVDVRGNTGIEEANAEISRILSEKLGEAEHFLVNVTYIPELDLVPEMPTPGECVAAVNAVLNDAKITFSPGSADIDRAARGVVDRIAEILKGCPDVAMEIGGFTDSQGREEMNQALSQNRAHAVLTALLARRVLTTNLKARGYGEEFPIADNETEEGREANRRIEFRLISAEGEVVGPVAAPAESEDAGTAADDVAEDQAGGEDVTPQDAVPADREEASGPDDPPADTDPQANPEAETGPAVAPQDDAQPADAPEVTDDTPGAEPEGEEKPDEQN